MSEWQPIASVPVNQWVLIYDDGVTIGCFDGHDWRGEESPMLTPPTHWMPLPDPPTATTCQP